MGKFFLNSLRFVTGSLVALYFLLPIIIRLVPGLSKQIIFLAFITRPFVRYDNPQRDYNLTASRNFYLDVTNDVRIGVWQFLPRSSDVIRQQSMTEEEWERSLSTMERPIFLYLHGNAFNRAALHRRELYDLLADKRYHVLAFDYRGFGDSTGTPTSDGLVADSMFVYKWLQERAGRNRILLWGHSLGTAVATELAAQITDLHEARTDIQLPLGVILEAPFNNLAEVIQHHPIAKPMRWLPWFEWIVQNPIRDEPVKFDTDVRIERTTMPFLIVHAEDDHVVPFFSGQQLYRHALDKGLDVQWYEFEGHHGYEHKFICRAPELPSLIEQFVTRCQHGSGTTSRS